MRLQCCGSGEPILFIHGIPTSNRLWDGITRRLSQRFRCYTLDLPGLGAEPHSRGGLGQLERIAEEIDSLRVEAGIEHWNVVGHDAGSAIAVLYTHLFAKRVERLTLMSPALFPDIRPYYLFELLRKPVLGELLAPCIHPIIWRIAMRRACQGEDSDSHLALAAFQTPFRGARGPWQMIRVLRWGRPEEVLRNMPALLSGLQPPTLIFHGSDDPAIPVAFAQRTAALIPNSTLTILKAGHFVPLNCPEAVAHNLGQFLSSSTYSPLKAASDSLTDGARPSAN